MFGKIITKLRLANHITAFQKCRSLYRKFHGEMTLVASAFAKPMKIRARLFLFDKPIKCFAFLFSRSYESRCYMHCSLRCLSHTPYIKMAAILLFVCLLAN